MLDPFKDDHSSYWIPYADFLAGVLSVFLVVAVLLSFYLTTPQKKAHEAEIKSPGSIMVEIFWKEDVDVDLWVRSPNDKPVGYSRKQGKDFDLLRDDIGYDRERVAGHHHENAFARVSPPGEYVVNVHMYSNRVQAQFPIAVEVAVQIKRNADEPQTVLHTTVNLNQLNQETTVVRFTLDDKGNLDRQSLNHEALPLRTYSEMPPL